MKIFSWLFFLLMFHYSVPCLGAETTASMPDSLFLNFALKQSTATPVYLDVRAEEDTDRIIDTLKREMLKHHYILLTEVQPDCNTLQVIIDKTDVLKETKRFLGYKRYQIPVLKCSIQMVSPHQEILDYAHTELYGKPVPVTDGYSNKLKWYDPIMIMSIIGSLVYIIWTTK